MKREGEEMGGGISADYLAAFCISTIVIKERSDEASKDASITGHYNEKREG